MDTHDQGRARHAASATTPSQGTTTGDDGVDSLSPTAQDYLKAIWSATEWGGPPMGSKKLADRFGSSTANATETVKRLANQGLVDYRPYHPVSLTEKGRALAIEMVRRHRLLETFLMTTLDYTWDEVHEEAERLEHAVSTRLINRIDALLGYPNTDPHGDPIPSADGTFPDSDDALQLLNATPDTELVVVRIDDTQPDDLRNAEEAGIFPGVGIAVVTEPGDKNEQVHLTIDGEEAHVPAHTAEAIWVSTQEN